MLIVSPASYLGTILSGRYRLERLIGEGASAWVFASQDLLLERDVAVKLLKPRELEPQAERSSRFVREGRTLAKLVHPHVVSIYDVGETPHGVAYLVMELSGAGNLEAELHRRGSLRLDETLGLLLPLFDALACAHQRGIIHRDIKPANIAVIRDQAVLRVKLLDFGTAGHAEPGESAVLTVGTPSYMAPEQARGEPLTPATDVWALGVVFFRCLSGRLPFVASTTTGMLTNIARQRAPWFADACPTLPPSVALALDRALEPKPARRYPNMPSFARALLTACLHDGVTPCTRPVASHGSALDDWLSADDVDVALRLTESLLPEHRPQAEPSDVGACRSNGDLWGTLDETQRILDSSAAQVAPLTTHVSEPVFAPPDWEGPLDLERRLALIPEGATVRGLFFNDLLAQFPAARAYLPRDRYTAFKSYPFTEWCEFLTAAATWCFPGCTPREGVRRVGKRAFPALAESHVGRVLFALAGADVFSSFRESARAFRLAQSLGSCTASELEPGLALLEIREAWDYPDAYYVGVYEGFFEAVGKAVNIDVRVHGPADVDLQLRWAP